MKIIWLSQKFTVYLLEWNFLVKYLSITPFLVLKDFRKLNTNISFKHRVEQYSLVKDIIDIFRATNRNITDELKNTAENLEGITECENMNPEKVKMIQFLIEKMIHSHTLYKHWWKRLSFYIKSRNFYNAMREYLTLSHPNNIKKYIGTIDSQGKLYEFENTIISVFRKLTKMNKNVVKYVLIKYT